MAENKLYEIHHGDDPASQTMRDEPERPEQVDPPPTYSPPEGQHNPSIQCPVYQGCAPGYQPQPASQPLPGPGYQQFHNPSQSTSTTTVVNVGGQIAMPRPSNFLVHSILSAIFCCPIFGIIGIIFAAQVDSAYDRGDYLKASSNSSMAKGWTTASFACGIVVLSPLIIYFILAATVLATESV